jgi:hypothetical protein
MNVTKFDGYIQPNTRQRDRTVGLGIDKRPAPHSQSYSYIKGYVMHGGGAL